MEAFIFLLFLALIPALIAKSKGLNFLLGCVKSFV